jgi:Arc/MetJ family transcription regulator
MTVRISVTVDEVLIDKVMRLSGRTSKSETVEAALELLARMESQKAIILARGCLEWHTGSGNDK